MEQILSHTETGSFYCEIILSMLEPMNKGTLEIFLPGGKKIQFGQSSEIKAEITVNDHAFFKKCVLSGDIGFGETYVEGLWDTPDISNVIRWFLLNIENAPSVSGSLKKHFGLNILKTLNRISHLLKPNSEKGAKKNISRHYDLDSRFFSLWLDETMTYSSAYFPENEMPLKEAQIAKYKRIAGLMKLRKDHHVLEIGCGWGANAIYLAENFGVKVTGVTISEEQFKFASQKVKERKLCDQIEIRFLDYRQIRGSFDRIISIEMLEAVGHRYLPHYFRKCHELLKPDGILALQVITCPDSRYDQLRKSVDWIQKYIFPGSLLPSVSAINAAINKTGDLTMTNLKDLGPDYAETLKIWQKKFNETWNEAENLGFDKTFKRKWNYYLSYCEAAFSMRNINVMQMIYTRPNNHDYS